MSDRQAQRAGDNSQQIQVAGDLILGVTEDRAREIAREQAQMAIAEYTEEATAEAQRRIGLLDAAIVDRLAADRRLEAMSDPGFQMELRRAQIGAASSERGDDYEMLAQLLADRADRGKDRTIRSGIHKAIEVVDQIDDSALLGLTVLQSLSQFRPMAPEVGPGLDALESLFVDLVYDDLPTGAEWLDHLDVLGAVRLSTSGGGLRKIADYYVSVMVPGYATVGVESGSELETSILERSAQIRLSPFLVDHALKPGYKRVPTPKMDLLEASVAESTLSDAQRSFVIGVARDEAKVDEVDLNVVPVLMGEWAQRPTLRLVGEWWDSIDAGLAITGVGKVLARANAQRHDTKGKLPKLD